MHDEVVKIVALLVEKEHNREAGSVHCYQDKVFLLDFMLEAVSKDEDEQAVDETNGLEGNVVKIDTVLITD